MPDSAFDAPGFVQTLPGRPGVYRMLGADGEVLYVGKARDLRRRVASYFRPTSQLAHKTQALMSHVCDVQVTVTHTETEALLLENNLIKEHRPRYNVLLRDDKSFPYIYLTTHEQFPRLAFHRGPRRGAGRYFGPYPSAGATRETLGLLQKLFQIRRCEDSFFRNRSRPCLQHQIQRCTAPCVGGIARDAYADDVRHAVMFLEGKSEEMIEELVGRMERAAAALDYELAARYRDQISSLRRVQERQYVAGAKGDIDVVATLVKDGQAVVQVFFIRGGQNLGNRTVVPRQTAGAESVEVLSAFLTQFYVGADEGRVLPAEIIASEPIEGARALEEVLSRRAGRRVSIGYGRRGERARWVEMARQNAEVVLAQRLAGRGTQKARLEALQEVLDLDEAPARIECFDISHTRGERPVAACVVFGPEGALKSDYRRFNIEEVAPGDDYGAIRQALTRRYTRLKRDEAKLPDLLVVDGGKGQLAEAMAVLTELQLSDFPVVAVAKGSSRRPGLETLFMTAWRTPRVLAADSPALHLIQQVRDEAHRFAITGHRTRRGRARNASALEQIPGIGARRRQRLLSEFGGLQGVARAGVEDLVRVRGVSRALAQAIYDRFHEGA